MSSSEPTPQISSQQSQQKFPRGNEGDLENFNIMNYDYKNKEIEEVCNNFVENLFLINPKSYESFGGNNYSQKNIVDINNKKEIKLENSQKKYSLESSPIHDSKHEENKVDNNDSESLKEINIEKNENNISKSNGDTKNNEQMSNICKDFIDEIFSQENEKYANGRNKGDELNIVGIIEHTKSKKSDFSNTSNKKTNEQNKENKNSFKITPEKVKYLIDHKKEIIKIQKNWKTYYDVNRFKLLKYKTLIIQNFYRKYLIKKYNLPSNFYYNDKFLKMQTELYEDTYKKNLNILFPSLFMDKSDLNEFASNMLEMANNPVHSPYESGKIFLFAKILDFDMMIDTNECYETLWASIYDSIYTKCLQNNDPIQLISLGSQHTICVTNKGKVYTFGWNNYGQCGVPINSTVVLWS